MVRITFLCQLNNIRTIITPESNKQPKMICQNLVFLHNVKIPVLWFKMLAHTIYVNQFADLMFSEASAHTVCNCTTFGEPGRASLITLGCYPGGKRPASKTRLSPQVLLCISPLSGYSNAESSYPTLTFTYTGVRSTEKNI